MEERAGLLREGRAACAAEAWQRARAALSAADARRALAAGDLELLATAAYMAGDEAAYLDALERAHAAHRDAGDALAAVRCAFWVGVTLARRGDAGRAGGWLARAERLLEDAQDDGVEHGYLLLPHAFAQEARGQLAAAAATAGAAAAAGARFGDPDLLALAAHTQGHLLIRDGRLHDGLRLLDEAMVAVDAGETSPIVSGIVYCGVILACREAHEARRAAEWTAALSEWCERQPDLVAFTGRCRTHRAEILQLRGAWDEGLAEARRARERCLAGGNPAAAGDACYVEGEIHRLRGDLAAAEQAYRAASAHGRDPQPGLALLQLAHGRPAAAAAALRRALAEAAAPADRLALLPAAAEVLLAAGAPAEAAAACRELQRLAADDAPPLLAAQAAAARGLLALDAGDAAGALGELRRAARLWHALDAAYETARARELTAAACRALGDHDAVARELDAAHAVYARIGARPAAERSGARLGPAADGARSGLTARELDVLRLVASGRSNREIAAQLVISEHTVARHLQNVFAKLGVSSRTAASAYVLRHGLL